MENANIVVMLKEQLNKLKEINDIKECLKQYKISILFTKDETLVKIYLPLKRKKVERLSPELQQKIQRVKELLKGKRDAIYLYTLLLSLHNELQKVQFLQKLDIESQNILLPAIDIIKRDLTLMIEEKK